MDSFRRIFIFFKVVNSKERWSHTPANLKNELALLSFISDVISLKMQDIIYPVVLHEVET